MGPQIRLWQDEWEEWFGLTTQHLSKPESLLALTTTDGVEVVKEWVPQKAVSRGRCYPYFLEEKNWTHLVNATTEKNWTQLINATTAKPELPLVFTEKSSELIGTTQCEGPNNCYPTGFKLLLSFLLVAHVVGHHVYVKFVMHGSIVDRLRKHKECERNISSVQEAGESGVKGQKSSEQMTSAGPEFTTTTTVAEK